MSPYNYLSSTNHLMLRIRKCGRICSADLSWVGDVGEGSAELTDFTVPEAFRPINTLYATAVGVTAGSVNGTTRITLSPAGRIGFVTSQQGYIERHTSFSYIGNDITPAEEYLVD